MKNFWHNVVAHPVMGWLQLLADIAGYCGLRKLETKLNLWGDMFHAFTDPN